MRSKTNRFGMALASLCMLAGALVPGGSGCGQLETEDPFVVPLEGLAPEGEYVPNQYIFFYRDRASDAEKTQTEQQFVAHGGKKLGDHPLFNAFSGEINPDGLNVMRHNSWLSAVQVNGIIRATGIQSCPPWGLDVIDQDGPIVPNNYYAYPSDGAGVHVYVLDSGIQRQMKNANGVPEDGHIHDEFMIDATKSRLGDGLCVTDTCCAAVNCDANSNFDDQLNDPTQAWRWDDDHGHGTHLAGIVGGKTYGVAKGVTLHAVKVLEKKQMAPECSTPEGRTTNLLNGLEAVVELQKREKAKSASMAAPPAVVLFGFSGDPGGSWVLLGQIMKSVVADMVVVASAGNEAKDACNYFPGGDSVAGPNKPQRTAITVGAYNDGGQMAQMSNFGQCVDILAPGSGILGPVSDDCFVVAGSTSATASFSGTSQAAAHVAGVAALLLREGVSPNQVKPSLLAHGREGLLKIGNDKPNTPNLAVRSPRTLEIVQSLASDDLNSPSCVTVAKDASYVCNPDGTCSVCGSDGMACCPKTPPSCAPGLTCAPNGFCQSSCGAQAQLCCANTSCAAGLKCVNGYCEQPPACGGSGGSCCDKDTCNAGLYCTPQNQCESCGGHGEPCCPSLSPSTGCEGDMACSHGTCNSTCHVRCGDGKLGFPNLETQVFVTQFDCIQWANVMCKNDTARIFFNGVPTSDLQNCGLHGEACCLPMKTCASGLDCKQVTPFPKTPFPENGTPIGKFVGQQWCQ